MENHIKGTIENFEGKMAVIKFEDGQTLKWPQKNLPDDAETAKSVWLVLKTSKSENEEREKLAKEMLNEILKK